MNPRILVLVLTTFFACKGKDGGDDRSAAASTGETASSDAGAEGAADDEFQQGSAPAQTSGTYLTSENAAVVCVRKDLAGQRFTGSCELKVKGPKGYTVPDGVDPETQIVWRDGALREGKGSIESCAVDKSLLHQECTFRSTTAEASVEFAADLTTKGKPARTVRYLVVIAGCEATKLSLDRIEASDPATKFQLAIASAPLTALPTPSVNQWFIDDTNGKYYASTKAGLAVSSDQGATFATKTVEHGLTSMDVLGAFAKGDRIFAATGQGLSLSRDAGQTFVQKSTLDGLPSNCLTAVAGRGNLLVVGTWNGVSFSTDGGETFQCYKGSDGACLEPDVSGVVVTANKIFVSTSAGLLLGAPGSDVMQKSTATLPGALIAANSTKVFAVTETGIRISNDAGVTFPVVVLPDELKETGFTGASAAQYDAMIATADSLLYVTRDALFTMDFDGTNVEKIEVTDLVGTPETGSCSTMAISGQEIIIGCRLATYLSHDGMATGAALPAARSLMTDSRPQVAAKGTDLVIGGLQIGRFSTTDHAYHDVVSLDGIVNDVVATPTKFYRATYEGVDVSTDGKTFTSLALGPYLTLGVDAICSLGEELFLWKNGDLFIKDPATGIYRRKLTMPDVSFSSSCGGGLLAYQSVAFVNGKYVFRIEVFKLGPTGVELMSSTEFPKLLSVNVTPTGKIYAMDFSGLLWLSQDMGLTFSQFSTAFVQKDFNLSVVLASSDTDLFVGLNSGLYRSKAGSDVFTRYTRENGLPSSEIEAVLTTGDFLIATSGSVVSYIKLSDLP